MGAVDGLSDAVVSDYAGPGGWVIPSVTNPNMAQRSDAQSRSETGAPAEITNNFGCADRSWNPEIYPG